MLKKKISTWLESSMTRAQKAFERNSGWSPRQLEKTLSNFSELKPVNRVFLGGLLFSNALFGKELKVRPAAKGRKRRVAPAS